jgi:hypothetical protein
MQFQSAPRRKSGRNEGWQILAEIHRVSIRSQTQIWEKLERNTAPIPVMPESTWPGMPIRDLCRATGIPMPKPRAKNPLAMNDGFPAAFRLATMRPIPTAQDMSFAGFGPRAMQLVAPDIDYLPPSNLIQDLEDLLRQIRMWLKIDGAMTRARDRTTSLFCSRRVGRQVFWEFVPMVEPRVCWAGQWMRPDALEGKRTVICATHKGKTTYWTVPSSMGDSSGWDLDMRPFDNDSRGLDALEREMAQGAIARGRGRNA